MTLAAYSVLRLILSSPAGTSIGLKPFFRPQVHQFFLNHIKVLNEVLNKRKVRDFPKRRGPKTRHDIRTPFLVQMGIEGTVTSIQFVEEPLFSSFKKWLIYLCELLRFSLINFCTANF